MRRNGIGPGPEPPDPHAALREPVSEVDDQRELGHLGRVDRRQRTELEPAGRTADDDVEARRRTPGPAGRARRRSPGSRSAAGSDSRPASSRPSRAARGAPTGSAARPSGTCRRRRTGSRASPTRSRPSGCRWRRAPRRRRGSCSRARAARAGAPGSGPWSVSGWRLRRVSPARFRSRPPGRRPVDRNAGSAGRGSWSPPGSCGDEVGHRVLEGSAAGGVVGEHVEAGRGRAEEHRRGAACGSTPRQGLAGQRCPRG